MVTLCAVFLNVTDVDDHLHTHTFHHQCHTHTPTKQYTAKSGHLVRGSAKNMPSQLGYFILSLSFLHHHHHHGEDGVMCACSAMHAKQSSSVVCAQSVVPLTPPLNSKLAPLKKKKKKNTSHLIILIIQKYNTGQIQRSSS